MGDRPYVSRVRAAATEAKRREIVEAAADFLRREPISGFSVEAVAQAAGVTRLTVYNQFGSRRGLLEAVFDHLAQRGRLDRIGDAVIDARPLRGLQRLVNIFCEFWGGDPAVGRLHDAMAMDVEFAQALTARNERRRHAIAALIERLPAKGSSAQRKDVIDLVFAMLSYPMFRLLSDGRSSPETCTLIGQACADALLRISPH
jgi:AcrR family transcriptional regulator